MLTARSNQLCSAQTYWMPADATPRFALERAAKEIFDFHTKGCHFPLARSGAEWWMQIRTLGGELITRRVAAGTIVINATDNLREHANLFDPIVDDSGLVLCPQNLAGFRPVVLLHPPPFDHPSFASFVDC